MTEKPGFGQDARLVPGTDRGAGNDRFGSKADVTSTVQHVCSVPKADISPLDPRF
jgi:hypothetical protein